MPQARAEPEREPWVFLLGRPPIEEYLGFLVQASPGENVDVLAAAQRWRNAATVVDGLTVSEAGIADARPIGDLPPALREKADSYLRDPAVAATYALAPASVGVVALADLVVHQRGINLQYAKNLQVVISKWGRDDERLFNLCLALDQEVPPINPLQSSQNSFVFRSRSADARFLGHALLDASKISGYTPPGRARYAVVLYVGYGVNALSVISVNGRIVLNNGSNRAYALMASGIGPKMQATWPGISEAANASYAREPTREARSEAA